MKNLSKPEQDAFIELANIGLSKAAESMSVIINEKVLLQTTQIGLDLTTRLEDNDRQKAIILTTHVLGDFQGICLLVFSEDEALSLQKKCLPASDDVQMKKALLLEIDNIISASVITQLANILDLSIYGGVPEMGVLDPEGLYQHLTSLELKYDPLLFSTTLSIEQLELKPSFFWFFNENLIMTLKTYANKRYKLSKK